MGNVDVILQKISQIAVFIILTFAVYLFFAGHYGPGGGFIGGLLLASTIVLLYLVYDLDTINKYLPINYRLLICTGILLSLVTGMIPMITGDAFLNQSYAYIDVPILQEEKMVATSVLFEMGVSLAVVGTVTTIITSISERETKWKF